MGVSAGSREANQAATSSESMPDVPTRARVRDASTFRVQSIYPGTDELLASMYGIRSDGGG